MSDLEKVCHDLEFPAQLSKMRALLKMAHLERGKLVLDESSHCI